MFINLGEDIIYDPGQEQVRKRRLEQRKRDFNNLLSFSFSNNQIINEILERGIALANCTSHVAVNSQSLFQFTVFSIAVFGHIQSYWDL